MNRLATAGCGLWLLMAAACGSGGSGTSDDYAAVVDGTRISRSDLDQELAALESNQAFLAKAAQVQGHPVVDSAGELEEGFVAQVLNRQVVSLLVHKEIVRRGLRVGEAEVVQADADERFFDKANRTPIYQRFDKRYRRVVARRSAEVVALQASIGAVDLGPAAVQGFYDAHIDELTETCVSHVLVDDPDLAASLRAEILAGRPFAEVASAASKDRDDGGSAAAGGALGCLRPEQMGGPFKEAVDSLAIGELSTPVPTDVGFHLIMVTGRRPPEVAEVAPIIRRRLLAPADEPYQAFLREALAAADVKIHSRYGRFDKSPGSKPVTAPRPAP